MPATGDDPGPTPAGSDPSLPPQCAGQAPSMRAPQPIAADRCSAIGRRSVRSILWLKSGKREVTPAFCCRMSCFKRLPPRSIQGREAMQTIKLAALMCFVLGTSAMADETVPEEYQGVWA